MTDIGRNDSCHCGSGKKYKKCCLEKDEVKNRKEREKAALNAAKVMEKEAEEAQKESEKKGTAAVSPQKKHTQQQQGWMGKMANKVGFFHRFTQQKTGGSGNKGG